jgi:hypothetical protein
MNTKRAFERLHRFFTRKEIHILTGVSARQQRRHEKRESKNLTPSRERRVRAALDKITRVRKKETARKRLFDQIIPPEKRVTTGRNAIAGRKWRTHRTTVNEFLTPATLKGIFKLGKRLFNFHYQQLTDREVINLAVEVFVRQMGFDERLKEYPTGRSGISLPKGRRNDKRILKDFKALLEKFLSEEEDLPDSDNGFIDVFVLFVSVKIQEPI